MIKQYFLLTTLLVSALFLTSVHADNNLLKQPQVQIFIQNMVQNEHFDRAELEAIFQKIQPMPEIVHHMNHPAEASPWDTYQHLFVTEHRINDGVDFWKKNLTILKEAEHQYHVPAPIIISILGVESNYGTHVMKYRAIDALTNLAFNYPSRQTFFTSQLKSFFILVRSHHLKMNEIYGSYAGAIGPAQFMPESILKYAVISDQDLNLSSASDWIKSVANFFLKKGWQDGKPLVTRIACPEKVPTEIVANSINNFYTPEQLRAAGIANNAKDDAMFVQLASSKGQECWLGYHNFAVIMRYNTSSHYAMAVVELSHNIQSSFEGN